MQGPWSSLWTLDLEPQSDAFPLQPAAAGSVLAHTPSGLGGA